MSAGTRYTNREYPVSAIQDLMRQMGADPPGYFAAVPRQPIGYAIHDAALAAPLRVVEFMRFHTVCYEGVPKNATGEPQYSPCCVGLDGKRLNQRDCSRETGLSTSVVKRIFDVLQRYGYVKIKKDGSIWYCGKVEMRGSVAVRLSVAECLQVPRNRPAGQVDQGLEPLVAGRVMAASLLKAARAFPAADQPAVETHLLEVARWERAEIARSIAQIRQEAARRYQGPVWQGYRLQKVGRTWVRVPAQESLFAPPLDAAEVPPDAASSATGQVFAGSAPMPATDNHGPARGENPPTPEPAPAAARAESSAMATGWHNGKFREPKPDVAAQSSGAVSGCHQQDARRSNSGDGAKVYAEAIISVPENFFVSSSPMAMPENQTPASVVNPGVPTSAASGGRMESSHCGSSLPEEERQETKPEVVAMASLEPGPLAIAEAAAPKPTPAGPETAFMLHIRRAFAGTGKGVPTDGQIREALAKLPQQATPEGFAGFIRSKFPSIRHAGGLIWVAQEYAYELQYGPRATIFQCGQCHDQGFVLGDGQYCACSVGLRRRQVDERGAPSAGP